MTRGIQIVCRPEVGVGFGLAGLRRFETSDAGMASARLHQLLSSQDTGLILVQEEFYLALPEEVRRTLGQRPLPIVIPFPGPALGARLEAPEAHIIEILRQAIGYRVRLR